MPVNTIDKYIEQEYPIQCKGRNRLMKEVLSEPVSVLVTISKSPGSNILSSTVNCPYNTGGHGQKCMVSPPAFNDRYDVICPYSFDIPYALDK